MRKSASLEFKSSAFGVKEGEDAHTQPGVFGKSLAQWFAEQLRARGIAAGAIVARDFGWCVPVESSGPHRLYAACVNAGPEPGQWRVFACAEGGWMARLLGKDQSRAAITALFGNLKQVLQNASHVRELRDA